MAHLQVTGIGDVEDLVFLGSVGNRPAESRPSESRRGVGASLTGDVVGSAGPRVNFDRLFHREPGLV